MVGSLINVLELFTFLFIINMFDTSDLDTMTEFGIIRNIKIISCCGLFGKSVFYMMTITSWFQELDSSKANIDEVPGKIENPMAI